jgi:hypothetical protein
LHEEVDYVIYQIVEADVKLRKNLLEKEKKITLQNEELCSSRQQRLSVGRGNSGFDVAIFI